MKEELFVSKRMIRCFNKIKSPQIKCKMITEKVNWLTFTRQKQVHIQMQFRLCKTHLAKNSFCKGYTAGNAFCIYHFHFAKNYSVSWKSVVWNCLSSCALFWNWKSCSTRCGKLTYQHFQKTNDRVRKNCRLFIQNISITWLL